MTEQGYRATSLDQVIAESSSSKGAFFHHFGSKSDLALQLTERYVAGDLANLDAGLAAVADIEDPSTRLVAFLRFFEDGADELMSAQSGCLYATVLAEREFTGSDINDLVAKGTTPGAPRSPICSARRSTDRRPTLDIDADALADHLYVTFEGAFILCRTFQDASAHALPASGVPPAARIHPPIVGIAPADLGSQLGRHLLSPCVKVRDPCDGLAPAPRLRGAGAASRLLMRA